MKNTAEIQQPKPTDLILSEIISNLEDKRRGCTSTESRLIYTDAICTVKRAFLKGKN